MYGRGSRGLLSPRPDFMSVSLLLVGLGSSLYHGTLRQTLQFVDDISMLVLGAAMLHGVYTVRMSASASRLTAVLICLPVAAFSAFYVRSGLIIYHTAAFVTQLFLLTVQSFYLFHWATPQFAEEKVLVWRRGQWAAIAVSLTGYLLWNIDLEFCAELRAIREQMGMPWGFVLELHGWWHLLTAIGAASFMNIVRDMHEEAAREKSRAAQGKDE
jgi:dihydroceramidase